MTRLPSLLYRAAALYAGWLGLSFHFTPLLAALGAASALAAAALGMRALARLEPPAPLAPPLRFGATLAYLPVLAWAMARSGLEVARLALASRRTLDALGSGFHAFDARPLSLYGRGALAHSITLTPGSASVGVGATMRVHLLRADEASRAGCEDLNRRAQALEAR